MKMLCRLHNVEFSANTTLTTDEKHKAYVIPQCPVCQYNEVAELRILAGALKIENAALKAAIKIKQKELYTTV